MSVFEALGRATGGLLSPLAYEGSLLRAARFFHPTGVAYAGVCAPLPVPANLLPLRAALLGAAPHNMVMRLSGGWWKNSLTMPDTLGVAMRFRGAVLASDPVAHPTDQDLLFESATHLYTLPLAPFTTNVRDYFANVYYAILPFQFAGVGTVKWRITPITPVPPGPDRNTILHNAVIAGLARFHLEVQQQGSGTWIPIINVTLHALPNLFIIPGYQATLAMTPFQAGQGITPVGYFNALRAAAYLASQMGRHSVGA